MGVFKSPGSVRTAGLKMILLLAVVFCFTLSAATVKPAVKPVNKTKEKTVQKKDNEKTAPAGDKTPATTKTSTPASAPTASATNTITSEVQTIVPDSKPDKPISGTPEVNRNTGEDEMKIIQQKLISACMSNPEITLESISKKPEDEKADAGKAEEKKTESSAQSPAAANNAQKPTVDRDSLLLVMIQAEYFCKAVSVGKRDLCLNLNDPVIEGGCLMYYVFLDSIEKGSISDADSDLLYRLSHEGQTQNSGRSTEESKAIKAIAKRLFSGDPSVCDSAEGAREQCQKVAAVVERIKGMLKDNKAVSNIFSPIPADKRREPNEFLEYVLTVGAAGKVDSAACDAYFLNGLKAGYCERMYDFGR